MRKGIYFLIIAAVLQSCSNENDPTIPISDPNISIEGVDQEVFGDVTVNFLVEDVEVISSKVLINNDEVESTEGLIESFTFDSNHFPEGENTISLQLTDNSGEEFIEQKAFTIKNTLFKSVGAVKLRTGSKGYVLISNKSNEFVNITELTDNEPFIIKRWDASDIIDLGVHFFEIKSNGYKVVRSSFGLTQSEIQIFNPDYFHNRFTIQITEEIADSVVYGNVVKVTPTVIEGSVTHDKIFMILYKEGIPYSLYLDVPDEESNEIVVTQDMLEENISSFKFNEIEDYTWKNAKTYVRKDGILNRVFEQSTNAENVLFYPGDDAAYELRLEFDSDQPSDYRESMYRFRSKEDLEQLSDPVLVSTVGYDYEENFPMSVMKPDNNFVFRTYSGVINEGIVYEWFAIDFGWDLRTFDLPIIPDSIDGFSMSEKFNSDNADIKMQHIGVIDLLGTPEYIVPGNIDPEPNWDLATMQHY